MPITAAETTTWPTTKDPITISAEQTTSTTTITTASSKEPVAYTTTSSLKATTIPSNEPTMRTAETTSLTTPTPPVPLITCSTKNSWSSNCGKPCFNVTSTGGVVQSPNFPGYYNYKNSSWNCLVAIRVPAGRGIQVSFSTLNLDVDTVLSVYDPNFLLWKTRSTGNSVPVVVNSTANQIFFIISKSFVPNLSNATLGSNWQATFTMTDTPFLDFVGCEAFSAVSGSAYTYAADSSECGKMCPIMTSTGTGVLESRNFPKDYGNDDWYCFLRFSVLNGRKIKLTFNAFNVETGYDSVSVYDTYYDRILYNASGSTIPVGVTTANSYISIDFKKANSFKSSNATYRWQASLATVATPSSLDYVTCSYSTPNCKGMCVNFTSTGSGVVQSPNFPGDYGNMDRDCTVYLAVPAGMIIQLKFNTFNLRTGHDSINVWDAYYNSLLSWVTGSTVPGVVTTKDNQMSIGFSTRYTTESFNTKHGWQATYTVVTLPYNHVTCYVSDIQHCEGMCANETSTGSGVVQSPNFPGNYGDYMECFVYITAPEGKRINLTFTTFNMRSSDFIHAWDGRQNSLLDDTTRSTIPAIISSTDNMINVYFFTKGSSQPSNATYGWQATYTVV